MRKLKLQVHLSIDGFVATQTGEPGWWQGDWDEGLKQHVAGITQDVDYILLEKLPQGDLVSGINKLKSEPGGDIIVYGDSGFVSSLIKEKLIDEFHLFINPTAMGKGREIFESIGEALNLTLETAKPFECGVVLLSYKPS